MYLHSLRYAFYLITKYEDAKFISYSNLTTNEYNLEIIIIKMQKYNNIIKMLMTPGCGDDLFAVSL